jgi:hypothetical protein
MQPNHRIVETVYVDRPARKRIMVPRWISIIVLTAVAIYSILFLIHNL